MKYKQYNRHVKLCKLNNKPLESDYLSIKQHLDKVTRNLILIYNDGYYKTYGNYNLGLLYKLYRIEHRNKIIWCLSDVWKPLVNLNVSYEEIEYFLTKTIGNKILTVSLIKELCIDNYDIKPW